MGQRDTIHQAATNAEKCDACQGHEVPGKIVFYGWSGGVEKYEKPEFFLFFFGFFYGKFFEIFF